MLEAILRKADNIEVAQFTQLWRAAKIVQKTKVETEKARKKEEKELAAAKKAADTEQKTRVELASLRLKDHTPLNFARINMLEAILRKADNIEVASVHSVVAGSKGREEGSSRSGKCRECREGVSVSAADGPYTIELCPYQHVGCYFEEG